MTIYEKKYDYLRGNFPFELFVQKENLRKRGGDFRNVPNRRLVRAMLYLEQIFTNISYHVSIL